MMNKPALLAQMDLFMEKFKELRNNLETGKVDEMSEMMRLSTERRRFFDK